MPRNYGLSLLLHAFAIFLMVVGLPAIFQRETEIQPTAMTVEIVPIKDISNIPKPQKPKPIRKEEPKPEPKKEKPTPPKKEEKKPEPKPEEKKPEPEKVPEPEPKKVEEKKPEPKKEEKKPEPKKEESKPEPKKDEDAEFEEVLKNLNKTKSSEETPKEKTDKPTPDSTKSVSDSYDPTKPLSISEIDMIRSQFQKCWSPPAGAKDDYSLRVEVRVLVNPDGTVKEAGLQPGQAGKYSSNPFFRAAADAAIRAVRHPDCNPLKNLPADKYGTWKDMIVTFDPKEILY